MRLSSENYSHGVLSDNEYLAGISENPSETGTYLAFVISHSTGEYVDFKTYPTLELALQNINKIGRNWTFSTIGGCSEGKCGSKTCKGRLTGACGACSKACVPENIDSEKPSTFSAEK